MTFQPFAVLVLVLCTSHSQTWPDLWWGSRFGRARADSDRFHYEMWPMDWYSVSDMWETTWSFLRFDLYPNVRCATVFRLLGVNQLMLMREVLVWMSLLAGCKAVTLGGNQDQALCFVRSYPASWLVTFCVLEVDQLIFIFRFYHLRSLTSYMWNFLLLGITPHSIVSDSDWIFTNQSLWGNLHTNSIDCWYAVFMSIPMLCQD